jgi:AcrR family transcriptional regulator
VPTASQGEVNVWMRPERPPRGPQPPLTRSQIAAAGIKVADALGADGISMRRVAAELGCGTMSLYRHVRNKDELLEVMIDAVASEDRPPPDGPGRDWRGDLALMAWRRRQTVLRHPWLVAILNRRPLLGPNMLAEMEFLLSAVDGLGLAMDEMVRVVRTVDSFVVGYTQSELSERQWRHAGQLNAAGEDWRRSAAPYVQHVVREGKHPYFTRMIAEAEKFPDPDATFEWGLQRVLDGLAQVIPAPAVADGARAQERE